MSNKVVFIDNSKLSGSVVKILARNIMMMVEENATTVCVIHLNELENFQFTNETLVLADPLIPLDHFFLKRYVPRRIPVVNFKLGSYSSLDYHGILEQINNHESVNANDLFIFPSLKSLFKLNA